MIHIMNLADEMQATFGSNEHTQARQVLDLLETEGTVIRVVSQGDGVMIEYEGKPRDLSCITRALYNTHKLAISGYDVNPTIGEDKVRLWLRPLSSF